MKRDERGSVLMLVPAGVLVLVILAAVCLDAALVFAAQRDLASRTAAVGNDIAGASVSDEAFYRGDGALVLDDRLAHSYVGFAFADGRRPRGLRSWRADVETSGRTVTVVAEAEVEHVFAKAIPGVADTSVVRARSVVTAEAS